MLYDAAVIGGGLAGAALAVDVARAGRSVVLFEKENGPHDKVCGEFISHEGVHYLAKLGVSVERLGSVPIENVRLARRGRVVTAVLPFEAQSLSRRILDEALLKRASEAGVEIRRGTRVKKLARKGEVWTVSVDCGGAIHAKEAFLATGKHDLKEWKRPPGPQPDLIAFKAYWRLGAKQSDQLGRHVELILFPGGYAGLQPVEGGNANLCLLVRKSAFAARYQSWDGLIDSMQDECSHLRMRLQGAQCLLEKPLAITGLPYGYVAKQTDGPWRLGDQAAVIPSFSGDGMSIALHSARKAADSYLRGETAAAYQQRLSAELSNQVSRATAISRMLVRPTGQLMAMAFARILPSTLPLGAGLTRIPAQALGRARTAEPLKTS
jgi:flavin-dependent dehydrogenase